MESIYMIGRTLAVLCVFIIVGYGLFVRPKEKDAPKRMSTFQWLMKKRREKKAAEAAGGGEVAGGAKAGGSEASARAARDGQPGTKRDQANPHHEKKVRE
jgi:hypothetical protein